jgi:hypothetical protein
MSEFDFSTLWTKSLEAAKSVDASPSSSSPTPVMPVLTREIERADRWLAAGNEISAGQVTQWVNMFRYTLARIYGKDSPALVSFSKISSAAHVKGRGTIANALKRNGIEPAPERSRHTTWSTFLRAHWKVLAASDFFTVEVWTGRGLITHYLLFVISLTDRVVNVVGITTRPDEPWMLQIARNVTDPVAGAIHAKRYLIIDRDAKYSEQFRRLIRDSGTNVIRLPRTSPNLNAYAERFVRSIKDECLNRMIFIGQASLRRAVAEYIEHYQS